MAFLSYYGLLQTLLEKVRPSLRLTSRNLCKDILKVNNELEKSVHCVAEYTICSVVISKANI